MERFNKNVLKVFLILFSIALLYCIIESFTNPQKRSLRRYKKMVKHYKVMNFNAIEKKFGISSKLTTQQKKELLELAKKKRYTFIGKVTDVSSNIVFLKMPSEYESTVMLNDAGYLWKIEKGEYIVFTGRLIDFPLGFSEYYEFDGVEIDITEGELSV